MTPAVIAPSMPLPKRVLRGVLALTIATMAALVVNPPSALAAGTGANFIATGHDMDYHCNANDANECAYLKLVVDLVRKGSTKPVLAVDHGSMLTTALSRAGVTPVTVINPANTAAFNAVAFTDGTGATAFSAIVVGSAQYAVSDSEITTINARSADFKTFFNAGGGILAMSSIGRPNYYNFVPISITGSSVQAPFTPTTLGASYGITSAMVNCCATHNSFATPTAPVVTLETDATGASETIAAFDAKITDTGFSTAPTVVITGGASVTTNNTTPSISGTTDAPAGSPVTVTVGGQTLNTTVAASGGTWSVTAATLAEGTYPVVVSITAGGKTGTGNQSLKIDTTAPVVAFNLGATALTREPTPTLRGTTGEPTGTVVTATVNGQTLTGTVGSGGAWNVTPTALPDGTYPVVASVTDAAGNSSSTTLTLTVDTRGPSLTVDGGPVVLTGDPVATVSGTTDADPGTTVTVSVAGQSLTASVTAAGTWSVSPTAVADGTYTITVSVSDPAGNVTTDTQRRTVDTTPPAVAFDDGETKLINTSTPVLSGTTEAPVDSTVTVTVNGQTLTSLVAYDGTWSATPEALADGTYPVEASAVDAAGNVGSATLQLTIDTAAPTITINGGRSVTTNNQTPTITGTTDAPAGSVVEIYVASQVHEAVVQPDGSWSVTLDTLAEGTPEVVAVIEDEAENIASAAQLLIVDVSAPALSIDGSGGILTSDPTLTISGTTDADPGSIVTFSFGEVSVTATVAPDGTWTLTLPTTADGSYEGTATVTDAAGNTGTATLLFDIDATAPVATIDGGEAAITATATPTISGTTDAPVGSTVVITVGGQELSAVVTDGGGWTITVPTALTDDTYTVSAVFTDDAGNSTTVTQSLTVDTTAPVGAITGGDTTYARSATPTISGTTDAPAGSTVSVTVGDQTLTTTVAEDGSWTVTVPTALTDGTYAVTATFTDAAGNTGSATQQVSVDTVAPTGSIDGGATVVVASTAVTISGRTDAAPGSSVTVTVNGLVLSALVADNGTWSTSVTVPDGTYQVVASFTDAAGNSTSATQSLTVDSTPPSASFTGGSSVTTNNHSPVISGVTDAPPGSTVAVIINGITYTTTVDVLGVWRVQIPDLPSGTYQVTVHITDDAGNTTTEVQSLTVTDQPVATSSAAPTSSAPTSGTPVDDLAYTGTDAESALWSAISLLVLGAGLVVIAGRRRGTAGLRHPERRGH